MFKKAIATTFLLGISVNTVFASELQDKQIIMKLMNNYINAVACATSKVQINNIVSIFPPEEDYTGSTYYVLWSVDKGCEGGSGTMSSYISEVSRYSSSRPFLVNTDDALGDNNEKSWTNGTSFTNYRFIESIKNKNNSLEVISWNYADDKFGGKDGGNNFPANKFRYTLKNVDGEGWKLVDQVLLEQNK